MKNNFIQIMFNFAPTLLSLLFLQIVVLPDLYKTNTEAYVQFNYLLYTALLFVHVANSASFNSAVINSKSYGHGKFDTSKFIFFISLYSVVVLFLGVFNDISLSIIIFILLLYPTDLLVNFLRLVEKDKEIAIILVLQSCVFVCVYYTHVFSVFDSYSLANTVCLLLFTPFLFKQRNFFYIEKLSGGAADLKLLISVSIPTINRYLDKVFILLFFSKDFIASFFPFIAMAGLILMPMSAVSKVLVRSMEFTVPKESLYFFISLLYPVAFAVIFGLVNVGVKFFYSSNTDFDIWIVTVICLTKTLNLIELLCFSLFSFDINYKSIFTSVSRLLTLTIFLIICIGFFYSINLSAYGVFFLLIYFLLSTGLLVFSIRGGR